MILAAVIFAFVATLVFLLLIILNVPRFWPAPIPYATSRIEKACDSVTSFIAFLIPATLAVATWVFEKTKTPWYGASLALSTVWLLAALIYTMYIRFNFVWRLPTRVMVGGGQNLQILKWLSTVMVGLTFGLVFLAIPVFALAFHPIQEKETVPSKGSETFYDYRIDQSAHSQRLTTPDPQQKKEAAPGTPNKGRSPCPCSLEEHQTPKTNSPPKTAPNRDKGR